MYHDIDSDGDRDQVMILQNGTTWVSYSIEENAAELKFNGSKSLLTHDVRAWTSLGHNEPTCLSDETAQDFFEAIHLPYAYYTSYLNVFANNNLLGQSLDIYAEKLRGGIANYETEHAQVNALFSQLAAQLEAITENDSCHPQLLSAAINVGRAQMNISESATRTTNFVLNEYVGKYEANLGVIYSPETIEKGYIIIDGFTEDSSAEKAGLDIGDKILGINGYPLEEF